MIAVLILVIVSVPLATSEQLSKVRVCQLRCTAKCVLEEKQSTNFCEERCEKTVSENLCDDGSKDREFCWKTCGGVLNEGPSPRTPFGVHHVYTSNYALNFTWMGDGTIYLLELSTHASDSSDHVTELLTVSRELRNYTKSAEAFCDDLSVRIASVTSGGISELSRSSTVVAPAPDVVQNLTVVSIDYINKPYSDNGYYSNGTVRVVLQFAKPKNEWPFGEDDINVDLLFHLISCDIPDLSKAVPTPHFFRGAQPRTLVANLGADLMYRKCQFLYYVSSVQSIRCGTTTTNSDFDEHSMKPLKIDCSIVRNSPCANGPVVHRPPMCGQVEAFAYAVLNTDLSDNDLSANITVNVSFSSTLPARRKPLYFVAFYGNAKPFDREIDVELLGVDMYDILGNATNCPVFNANGTCELSLNSINSSIEIGNLKMNTLYGVMICAVIDLENLTFPTVDGVALGMKSKANKVFIDSTGYSKSGFSSKMVLALFMLIFSGSLLLAFVYVQCKHKQEMKLQQIKLEQLKTSSNIRYTDMPKKHDIWELERRNLIIHDDKKLGAGAFGAVYKGRLIGVARGCRHAQSSLSVNLMRAENCDVAVKMLPEYADDLSKSDFLREIGLMKTLGYHERLVNMLACITDSEPYCLIVEYCSDGDLLKFLRQRCNYMIKLTEMGIDYDCAELDDQVNVEMIITLRQLLMFAVQISYGLEYLCQKGFVHRDVAARNVLVHEKTNAKIGDFGLCRYIYADCANYKGKGGRLPVKWMSPEAIKHYEFTTKSDVWSFGILMFEIITLGGSPYPGVQPDDMLEHLDAGARLAQPDNCPDNFYTVMRSCWAQEPEQRPSFGVIRQKLAGQLEEITDEYSYLKLDSQREYYNVTHDLDTKEHNGTAKLSENEISDGGDPLVNPKFLNNDQFDRISLSSTNAADTNPTQS